MIFQTYTKRIIATDVSFPYTNLVYDYFQSFPETKLTHLTLTKINNLYLIFFIGLGHLVSGKKYLAVFH